MKYLIKITKKNKTNSQQYFINKNIYVSFSFYELDDVELNPIFLEEKIIENLKRVP